MAMANGITFDFTLPILPADVTALLPAVLAPAALALWLMLVHAAQVFP